MKNILIFLAFWGILGILNAQDNKFTKKEQADEAYVNKLFLPYEPMFLDGHKELRPEEDTISFPYYTIAKMKIVGGRFWVIQKPQTLFVVLKKDKKIIRRWDCGNEITGFGRPPEIETEEGPFIPFSMLSQLKIPGPKGEKGDKGDSGRNGRDGKIIESSYDWLIWTGIGVAVAIAIAALLHSKENQSAGMPPSGTTGGGTPPGGKTGPTFKISFGFK